MEGKRVLKFTQLFIYIDPYFQIFASVKYLRISH